MPVENNLADVVRVADSVHYKITTVFCGGLYFDRAKVEQRRQESVDIHCHVLDLIETQVRWKNWTTCRATMLLMGEPPA